jgi:hexulose-6-phosphate isomerase
VAEGHSAEAVASAVLACFVPVPNVADREEPIDAPKRSGPPSRPFDKPSGGKRTFAKRPPAKQPYDDAWTLSMEQIRKALPVAKECGIKIAVENVWNNFLLSPLEAARYVDDFKDPSVVWHFDIGNVINTGFPAQWIKVLGKRIAKLHIKDFSRKKRDDQGLWKGFDVELGQGDADWPAVIKALDEVGYSTAPEGNWATAEVGGGDAKHLTKIREIMQTLLISPVT